MERDKEGWSEIRKDGERIQYNTITLYCPEPGNSFCSVRRHKNIKYRVEK